MGEKMRFHLQLYAIIIAVLITANLSYAQSTTLSLQNFRYGPNPFYQTRASVFTIHVQPTVASNYELYIFDMSRHLVFKHSGTLNTTVNTIQWNGHNLLGEEVASGPYMGILIIQNGAQVIKKRIPIGYFQ